MTIMDKDDSIWNNKSNNKSNKKSNDKKLTKKKATKIKKKHPYFYKMISFLLIVMTIIMVCVVIYHEIFTIFYLIPLILIIGLILFVNAYLLNKNNLRNWVKNIFAFFSIIFIVLDLLMIFYGTSTLKFLSNITDTGYRVETFGIYSLDDSNINSIKDLNDKNIFYLDHEDDKSIREAISKIKKKKNINVDYKENVEKLINSLMTQKSDAIVMETSYEEIVRDEFPDYYKRLKRIDTIDIVSTVTTIQSDVDITQDSFVIYLSGIDTNGNIQSKSRSDVNLLLAVNPKTKNIVLINTPRDYYVTLHSKKKKDKLTHAGIYGVEESVHTLEDLYDTDIDYYARINFTSFIKMVNALDGIKVDVPLSFCEQDSERNFDAKKMICLNKGYQSLNGEQALALARHRKSFALGDVKRGENQMMILEAIINKAMSPKVIIKYTSIINALEGRVSTNMTTNEMIRFTKKQIGKDTNWKFVKINAEGTNSSGVCYSTSVKSYVMAPKEESVNKIKDALDRLFADEDVIV